MSSALPARPVTSPDASYRYAIVESSYNEKFVKPMADCAESELLAIEPNSSVTRVISPGSFEIPLMVSALLDSGKYDAVLALGVILQGETSHASLIASSVTDALMRLAIKHKRPVIHEVLLLQNEGQAEARCLGGELNRGVEAARAATSAVAALRAVRKSKKSTKR